LTFVSTNQSPWLSNISFSTRARILSAALVPEMILPDHVATNAEPEKEKRYLLKYPLESLQPID
jgi:hypothetical protein